MAAAASGSYWCKYLSEKDATRLVYGELLQNMVGRRDEGIGGVVRRSKTYSCAEIAQVGEDL